MSVTRTGSIIEIHSSANSGSQSITVPADAELMVCGVCGYEGEASYFSDAPTIGGLAMTLIRDDDGNGSLLQACIFRRTSPPTGSQTFAWNWAGSSAVVLGAHIFIAFYKGVDTTTPIGATGGSQDSDNSATTGSLTAASGDAVFAVAAAYNNTGLPTITWTNATDLDDDAYNGIQGSCAEAFPAGSVTLTAAHSGGSGSQAATTISAVVIKQAAGGGINVTPAAATAKGSRVDPNVMLGSLIITPGAGTAKATSVSPTAILGSLFVTPSAGYAKSITVAPTVVLGSLILLPNAAITRGATVNPTVISGGNIVVIPNAATMRAAGNNPTIILGAINLLPASAVMRGIVSQPSTLLGSVTVTPAALTARARGVDAIIILGALSLSPTPVAGRLQGANPNVLLGSILLIPTAGMMRGYVIQPTVIGGETAEALGLAFLSIRLTEAATVNDAVLWTAEMNDAAWESVTLEDEPL